MDTKAKIDVLVNETLFPPASNDTIGLHLATKASSSTDFSSVYPETLLHRSTNAYKYYLSFQRGSHQFMDDTLKESSGIARFEESVLNHLSRQKVLSWDDPEHEVVNGSPDSDVKSKSQYSPKSGLTASSLFSWSSSDKYIAARKMELSQKKDSFSEDSLATGLHSPSTPSRPKTPPVVQFKSSLTNRLNAVVERESNKFIQSRIELIKAHHIKQASRRIDERRKNDHNTQLRRVRLKEEKYEKIIKNAIAVQNTKRNSGFFGSLFGSKPISNSFTLDLVEGDLPSSELSPSKTSDPGRLFIAASPSQAFREDISAMSDTEKQPESSPLHSSSLDKSSQEVSKTKHIVEKSGPSSVDNWPAVDRLIRLNGAQSEASLETQASSIPMESGRLQGSEYAQNREPNHDSTPDLLTL